MWARNASVSISCHFKILAGWGAISMAVPSLRVGKISYKTNCSNKKKNYTPSVQLLLFQFCPLLQHVSVDTGNHHQGVLTKVTNNNIVPDKFKMCIAE